MQKILSMKKLKKVMLAKKWKMQNNTLDKKFNRLNNG